jgi:hypothetical protein
MKPPSKRSQLAMRLIAQAYTLERMAGAGLDSSVVGKRNTANLIELLRSAAKMLDSKAAAVRLP